MNNKLLEVLTPAGDTERFNSAIRYGADAVYLGRKTFGMRSSPMNFDYEQLTAAVNEAHSKGVKVYLTCNTLPRNNEIPEFQQFIEEAVAAKVDALIFDAFSNPHAPMIEERLFPFIEKIQTAHPDIPLIFQQTIYREKRNFNTYEEAKERAKQETAARLMAEACKKYKNVYFIQTDATDELHETSVDGTHPGDYGYTLWAKSIEKPLLKILKKYGIK